LRQHVIDITKHWEGKVSSCYYVMHAVLCIRCRLISSDQHGQLVLVGAVVFDAAQDGLVLPRNGSKQQSAQPTVRHV
jgi:hypothetical protein